MLGRAAGARKPSLPRRGLPGARRRGSEPASGEAAGAPGLRRLEQVSGRRAAGPAPPRGRASSSPPSPRRAAARLP